MAKELADAEYLDMKGCIKAGHRETSTQQAETGNSWKTGSEIPRFLNADIKAGHHQCCRETKKRAKPAGLLLQSGNLTISRPVRLNNIMFGYSLSSTLFCSWTFGQAAPPPPDTRPSWDSTESAIFLGWGTAQAAGSWRHPSLRRLVVNPINSNKISDFKQKATHIDWNSTVYLVIASLTIAHKRKISIGKSYSHQPSSEQW